MLKKDKTELLLSQTESSNVKQKEKELKKYQVFKKVLRIDSTMSNGQYEDYHQLMSAILICSHIEHHSKYK